MAIPRAVLFDLDGTLVDSLRELAQATNQTLVSLGIPAVSESVIRTRIGQGARALVARSVDSEVDLDAALERFNAYYASISHRSLPYPGVVQLLERLGRHRVLRGVATNKPARFTATVIRGAGLDIAVDGWASADEAERKPRPEVLSLGLARCGGSAFAMSEVVYVGDMPVDIIAARNMGCRALGVSWGFDPDGLRAAQPDGVADDADALAALLGLPD